MAKLKVSKEIKKDLDNLLINIKKGDKESILNQHIQNGWCGFYELNKLSLEELTICLFIGYELEKTPQEEINELLKKGPKDEYDACFHQGIKFIVNKLKIKGINA